MTEALAPPDRPLRIEIVTPVYNRREITLQCLRSLARIDRTNLEIHVIIVDDGSSDGTSEALRRDFPEVEILLGDGNLSYVRGTNLAVEAALTRNPDYILAINNDSIFHEQFLQRLIACARAHPRSIVGPVLLLWDEPHRVAQVGARWQTWFGGWRIPLKFSAWDLPQTPFDVDIIVGNCILFPADAIRENGVMNAKVFPWAVGDLEWTPRMKRAGWRLLIEPRSLVWFEPNTPTKSPGQMSKRQLLRALFTDWKNPYYLKSQFNGRWYSAPSRFLALIAFFIYLWRLGLRSVGLGGSWPIWPDQPI